MAPNTTHSERLASLPARPSIHHHGSCSRSFAAPVIARFLEKSHGRFLLLPTQQVISEERPTSSRCLGFPSNARWYQSSTLRPRQASAGGTESASKVEILIHGKLKMESCNIFISCWQSNRLFYGKKQTG